MLYHGYEIAHAVLAPFRQMTTLAEQMLAHPLSPLSYAPGARHFASSFTVFNELTRRIGKPDFGITETTVDGEPVAVTEHVAAARPFCDLLHFERALPSGRDVDHPRVLIVAPMSGHFATLLRGTVAAMLPEHDVYVTDWKDARDVPVAVGRFDLDDYVDHVIDFLRLLGPDTHVMAVCQPSVPVLAATALMAEDGDPCMPISLTLMGGPIDPRQNPTQVNEHAITHDLGWFRRNVISYVPFPNLGAMRTVYPGFMQLGGFMAMNLDVHIGAHHDYYERLVEGDLDGVDQHRRFYDEYMAVMDLTAEFFLQTVETVFQRHALAHGTMTHRGRPVDCSAIRNLALITVEGENDDICGLGQTEAAHGLCSAVDAADRVHYVQPGVGHYGVFNGRRWRNEIQPRVRDAIRAAAAKHGEAGKPLHSARAA